MAFFFTLLYVLTAFVSPPVLFGPLSEYHAEIIIAMLAMLCSLPSLRGSGLIYQPQTRAICGLWVCVVASVAVNTWLRGGATAFYNFVPVTFTYFLTALNCRTKRHLQWIFVALFLGSLNFIVRGYRDLHADITPSLYLYGDEGLRRLRGLGLINDPNDFSQVMVSLIPCMFLLRRKSAIGSFVMVGVPVAMLLMGLYLAHSRGAAIGLMAVVILAARRKIGTLPAIALAGTLFAGSLAFGWSGGREVSIEAGADRLDAWVMGIEFIKAHPLLGIGNNRFGELNYITAHNSIVVCAAENGILGFVCWILFVFSSLRLGVRISSATIGSSAKEGTPSLLPETRRDAWTNMLQERGTAGVTTLPASVSPSGQVMNWGTATDVALPHAREDVQRTAQLLVFALTGFLTAGWFLSRALSPWMFMYGGMIVAVKRMAEDDGLVLADEPFPRLVGWAIAISAGLLILVYVTLKIRSLTGG